MNSTYRKMGYLLNRPPDQPHCLYFLADNDAEEQRMWTEVPAVQQTDRQTDGQAAINTV